MLESSHYAERIRTALLPMISEGASFNRDTQERIAGLRAYLYPKDDDAYLYSVYDANALSLDYASDSRNTLNPVPYEIVKRATSGFLAYHHTPWDKFFETRVVLTKEVSDEDVDKMKDYWRHRDARVHGIMQQPHNVMQEALFIMSRLVFNLGVKTLDFDSNYIVRKTTHPVERIMMYSSNSRDMDIVGVWEPLTLFQYKMRYPKVLMPRADAEEIERSRFLFSDQMNTDGKVASAPIKVYRFNMPVKVFVEYMRPNLYEEEEALAEFNDRLTREYKLSSDHILDLVVDDKGNIISMDSREYRTVIIGHLGPVLDGIRGKSQGDVALATARALQEAEQILMDGFESNFAPAWAMPSALEERAFGALQKGEIVFSEDPENIRPLLLQLDLRMARELIMSWEERLEQLFFLDVFTLIEKSRMPTAEIAMRRSDGFKQLGLYVASDTSTNLEPEVLSIQKMDMQVSEIKPPDVETGRLQVRYVSPIIQAIKQTTLEEYTALNNLFGMMAKIEESPVKKFVDMGRMYDTILEKTDNDELKVPLDERELAQKEENMQKNLMMREQLAKTQTAANQNVAAQQQQLEGLDARAAERGEAPEAGTGGSPA